MVELQPSKLIAWVRFPSPAPTGRPRGGTGAADMQETGRTGSKTGFDFHLDALLCGNARSSGRDEMAAILTSEAKQGNGNKQAQGQASGGLKGNNAGIGAGSGNRTRIISLEG